MKEFIKEVVTDIGSGAVNYVIKRVVITILVSMFIVGGVLYIRKRTEKQLKQAVIEVQAIDAEKAGEIAGDVAKDFSKAKQSFLEAYKEAKNDTIE